jgi:hypothetical protein
LLGSRRGGVATLRAFLPQHLPSLGSFQDGLGLVITLLS